MVPFAVSTVKSLITVSVNELSPQYGITLNEAVASFCLILFAPEEVIVVFLVPLSVAKSLVGRLV